MIAVNRGQIVLDKVGAKVDMGKLWTDMGFTMTNGKDMTSVMYRIHGAPIYEQTLGSADAMLLRLLDGDETVGGEKQPYDPRIHFAINCASNGCPPMSPARLRRLTTARSRRTSRAAARWFF